MMILAKYYLPEVIGNLQAKDIHQVPEQVKQALQSQPFRERLNRVFTLALQSRQLFFIRVYLMKHVESSLFQEILTYADSHLKFLKGEVEGEYGF